MAGMDRASEETDLTDRSEISLLGLKDQPRGSSLATEDSVSATKSKMISIQD
jgi:hypothetical protein